MREAKKIEKLFIKLTKASRRKFEQGVKDVPKHHGVYIIYDSRDRIVHVGRTLRAKEGLFQRMKDHLNTNSSFARNFLGDGKRLKQEGYKFSYIVVKKARTRALLESLAIGKLCPEYLATGEKKQ